MTSDRVKKTASKILNLRQPEDDWKNFTCTSMLVFASVLRASTSVDVKLCKMQKSTNFTHFALKIFYISFSKTVYIYTFTIVTVHICTVTVDVYLIILLISHSHIFFSLFSMHNKLSDFSSPHLLFPQIHTNTATHKHIHIDKSTQIYTNTHTQTNPHRQTNRETDCCLTGMIGACGSTGMGFEAACGRDDAWGGLRVEHR